MAGQGGSRGSKYTGKRKDNVSNRITPNNKKLYSGSSRESSNRLSTSKSTPSSKNSSVHRSTQGSKSVATALQPSFSRASIPLPSSVNVPEQDNEIQDELESVGMETAANNGHNALTNHATLAFNQMQDTSGLTFLRDNLTVKSYVKSHFFPNVRCCCQHLVF